MKKGSAEGHQRGITLIELLAAMVVAGILTTMMLGSWFALGDSYSFSVNSNEARDKARQAISRLEREIRDSENRSGVAEVAVVRSRPFSIMTYTTFNLAGNQSASTLPRLVMYRLYSDGELWRFQDLNGNGTIANVNTTLEPWYDPVNDKYDLDEQRDGEGAQMVVDKVVNMKVPSPGSTTTPLFRYAYYDTDGSTEWTPIYLGTGNRLQIKAVEIHLLVDTNPERSPVYTNLKTTAQLRNQR